MRPSSQNVNCGSCSPSHPAQCAAQGFQSPPQSPRPSAGGFVQAHAKINLFLDVLGKRTDGYHDIVSVMQSLDLCDELTITVVDEPVQVHLICDEPALPTDDSNLIIKAAKLMMQEYNISQSIRIELTKSIPMGAGLAGGSSDCAATLHGINDLFNLRIPNSELLQIGRSLGADVPFCLTGGTALTEGIGEKITPLPPLPECYIVIVCPDIHVSTAEIFAKLSPEMINSSNLHTHKDYILKSLQNADLRQLASSFYNVFTQITEKLHPEIPALISALCELGALGVNMTGTGSAVFALFENGNDALKAYDTLKHQHKSFICKPFKAIQYSRFS